MKKNLSYRKDIWILLLRPWSYIFILTTRFLEILMMRIWRHFDENVIVPCRCPDLYWRDLVMYSSWHRTTSSVFDLSRHNFFWFKDLFLSMAVAPESYRRSSSSEFVDISARTSLFMKLLILLFKFAATRVFHVLRVYVVDELSRALRRVDNRM